MKTGKIKILLCEPVPAMEPNPRHRAYWNKTLEKVARPDVTLDYVNISRGYLGLSGYEQLYGSVEMVKRAFQAEKHGYDAFIIGCASDMALMECRSLVNIPVIAPTEACGHIAATLGNKFSIIDLQYATRPVIEGAVRNAGLSPKLASVRSPEGMDADKVSQLTSEDPAKAVQIFRDEMKRAIKEDGAEALLVSCMLTSAFLTEHGLYEVEGVPVIDLLAGSLKMAEIMIDLQDSFGTGVCKNTIYRATSSGWDKELPILEE
jgi:allantoin racemase